MLSSSVKLEFLKHTHLSSFCTECSLPDGLPKSSSHTFFWIWWKMFNYHGCTSLLYSYLPFFTSHLLNRCCQPKINQYITGKNQKSRCRIISLEGGPLPVISGVIVPISRVISPQLPMYFRPFIKKLPMSLHLFQDWFGGPPCSLPIFLPVIILHDWSTNPPPGHIPPPEIRPSDQGLLTIGFP